MAMDYREVASEVIGKVGGRENVESVMHCVTRLRFVLKDESKADDDGVKAIGGVKGMVKQGGQYQVIIGTPVAKVAKEAVNILGKELGSSNVVEKEERKKKDTLFHAFFKTISGCIFPFMGLMIASGMLKGLLTLLVSLNIISEADGFYQLLYAGPDGSIGRCDMVLPWREDIVKLLDEKVGMSTREFLSLLFIDGGERANQIRFQYMDLVSSLYAENFSQRIGDWCREHGVESIGHIIEDNNASARLGYWAGHFFRAMKGQELTLCYIN